MYSEQEPHLEAPVSTSLASCSMPLACVLRLRFYILFNSICLLLLIAFLKFCKTVYVFGGVLLKIRRKPRRSFKLGDPQSQSVNPVLFRGTHIQRKARARVAGPCPRRTWLGQCCACKEDPEGACRKHGCSLKALT